MVIVIWPPPYSREADHRRNGGADPATLKAVDTIRLTQAGFTAAAALSSCEEVAGPNPPCNLCEQLALVFGQGR
jgi:hypothetical protein